MMLLLVLGLPFYALGPGRGQRRERRARIQEGEEGIAMRSFIILAPLAAVIALAACGGGQQAGDVDGEGRPAADQPSSTLPLELDREGGESDADGPEAPAGPPPPEQGQSTSSEGDPLAPPDAPASSLDPASPDEVVAFENPDPDGTYQRDPLAECLAEFQWVRDGLDGVGDRTIQDLDPYLVGDGPLDGALIFCTTLPHWQTAHDMYPGIIEIELLDWIRLRCERHPYEIAKPICFEIERLDTDPAT